MRRQFPQKPVRIRCSDIVATGVATIPILSNTWCWAELCDDCQDGEVLESCARRGARKRKRKKFKKQRRSKSHRRKPEKQPALEGFGSGLGGDELIKAMMMQQLFAGQQQNAAKSSAPKRSGSAQKIVLARAPQRAAAADTTTFSLFNESSSPAVTEDGVFPGVETVPFAASFVVSSALSDDNVNFQVDCRSALEKNSMLGAVPGDSVVHRSSYVFTDEAGPASVPSSSCYGYVSRATSECNDESAEATLPMEPPLDSSIYPVYKRHCMQVYRVELPGIEPKYLVPIIDVRRKSGEDLSSYQNHGDKIVVYDSAQKAWGAVRNRLAESDRRVQGFCGELGHLRNLALTPVSSSKARDFYQRLREAVPSRYSEWWTYAARDRLLLTGRSNDPGPFAVLFCTSHKDLIMPTLPAPYNCVRFFPTWEMAKKFGESVYFRCYHDCWLLPEQREIPSTDFMKKLLGVHAPVALRGAAADSLTWVSADVPEPCRTTLPTLNEFLRWSVGLIPDDDIAPGGNFGVYDKSLPGLHKVTKTMRHSQGGSKTTKVRFDTEVDVMDMNPIEMFYSEGRHSLADSHNGVREKSSFFDPYELQITEIPPLYPPDAEWYQSRGVFWEGNGDPSGVLATTENIKDVSSDGIAVTNQGLVLKSNLVCDALGA